MSKRKFEIIIGVVGLLVVVGCFAAAERGTHYFKIPVFKTLYDIAKVSAVVFYGICKLFIVGIWNAVMSNWLTGLVSFGLVLLVVLLYYYRKNN